MATVTKGTTARLEELLGEAASNLLEHKCQTVPKSQLHLPGPDFVSRVWKDSDRSVQVLRNLQSLFDHGRLAGSGYLSILPVDQGIEHTAGASFAPNPIYFDGEKIVELAIEGGCNAVASTFGVLGAVGATIYWGSAESDRQLVEIANAFQQAHELGMATVLWCYVRNSAFKKDGVNYETAADLTGQANHLGVSIQADIIKQKLADTNRGFEVIGFSKTAPGMYDQLATNHPIDLCRYQVINCFMSRASLINSGGESKGAADLKDALRTAVINKRAGGTGLIAGRKSFQRPMKEGVELLHAIQDVYLNPTVTIA